MKKFQKILLISQELKKLKRQQNRKNNLNKNERKIDL
jgi:hypothetical protein